jgi:hypothetical protein
MAEEVLEIADSADEETINQAKVRIAARQWMLSKALPHTYGDKMEHSGRVTIEQVAKPRRPSPERLAEILARFDGAPRDERATEAERQRREALAPEMEEYEKALVDLGMDEDEARSHVRLDTVLSRYFPEDDAATRRRKRADYIKRRFAGEDDEAPPRDGEPPN